MPDSATLIVFATGGHGRLYPELLEETRTTIIKRFNSHQASFFPGVMGFRVVAESHVLRSSRRSAYAEVDLWSGGKLAGRASTTFMIKPLAEPGRSPS